MTNQYPKYTSSARKGERGVRLVAHTIDNEFGWLFKRNHQEHDFGIDGQIEVITEEGFVTGQILAAQIKFGFSFFKETNKWGFVYRGEKKHFNYLSNYPIPVLIILCDESSCECYWVRFEMEQTMKTQNGWKITVPFENKLKVSKQALLEMVSPTKDCWSKLEEYWAVNDILMKSKYVLFILSRSEIENLDTIRPQGCFERLTSNKELAYSCKSCIEFSISGYDFDERELFEIEEVRQFVLKLYNDLQELLFFANTAENSHFFLLMAFCFSEASVIERASTGSKLKVSMSNERLGEFLLHKWSGLNKISEWLELPIEENMEISFAAARRLGIELPDM